MFDNRRNPGQSERLKSRAQGRVRWSRIRLDRGQEQINVHRILPVQYHSRQNEANRRKNLRRVEVTVSCSSNKPQHQIAVLYNNCCGVCCTAQSCSSVPRNTTCG